MFGGAFLYIIYFCRVNLTGFVLAPNRGFLIN